MANSKKNPSDLLGEILRRLLEETGVDASRTEWARRLHVDPSVVSKWINQHVLIQPRQLLQILDIVDRDGDDHEPVHAFWKVAALSPEEVAPMRSLPCSIGEWVAKAEKERLMEQLENEDGRMQLMICRVAADFGLLASRAELELGSVDKAADVVTEIGMVMRKLIARHDLTGVRDLVVAGPSQPKRKGADGLSRPHRIRIPVMNDQDISRRHQLTRGAHVAPVVLAAPRSVGPNVIAMRRLSADTEAATSPKSIPGFSWRWAQIETSLSLSDMENCREAFIFVCRGAIKVQSETSEDVAPILRDQYICRISERPSLAAVTLYAMHGAPSLVFLLFAIGGAEDAYAEPVALTCEELDLSDESKLKQQRYVHQPATGAFSHTRAYQRKEIARSPIKAMSSKGGDRRIHCDIIRASGVTEKSEHRRDIGSHPGHEVIIPIVGDMVMYFGEPSSRIVDPSGQLGKFKNPRQVRLRAINSDASRIPDVLVFDSNVAHGFAAAADEYAYALHLRLSVSSNEATIEPESRGAEVHTFLPSNTAAKSDGMTT